MTQKAQHNFKYCPPLHTHGQPCSPCLGASARHPCLPLRCSPHLARRAAAQLLTLRQHLPPPQLPSATLLPCPCAPPPSRTCLQCSAASPRRLRPPPRTQLLPLPSPSLQRSPAAVGCDVAQEAAPVPASHTHLPLPALSPAATLTCRRRLRRGPRPGYPARLSLLPSGTSHPTIPAPLGNLQRSPPAAAGCGAALGPAPPPAAPLSSIAATSADRGTLLALPSLPCSLWMVRARASRNSRSGARAACAGAGGGGGEVWNTEVWSDQGAGVHSWWSRAQGAICWLGPTMHMLQSALVGDS